MGMNGKMDDADSYAKWFVVKTGPAYLTSILNELTTKISTLKLNLVYITDSSVGDRDFVAAFETWIASCIASKPTPP